METKKRSPILAPLLSIVAPGLGQIYNGQLVNGIIVYLMLFLLFVILSLIGLQFKFYGMIFTYALLICSELLVLVGLGVVIWVLFSLFFPPKKHKEFSLHDRDEATIRALGGSGPPDLSKLEPEEMEQKNKKHKN